MIHSASTVTSPGAGSGEFNRHLIIEASDAYHSLAQSTFAGAPLLAEWIKPATDGAWVSAKALYLPDSPDLHIGHFAADKLRGNVRITILGPDDLSSISHYRVNEITALLDLVFKKAEANAINSISMEVIGRQPDSLIVSALNKYYGGYLLAQADALGIDAGSVDLRVSAYGMKEEENGKLSVFDPALNAWQQDDRLMNVNWQIERLLATEDTISVARALALNDNTRSEAQNMIVKYAQLTDMAKQWDDAVVALKTEQSMGAEWHILLEPQTNSKQQTLVVAVNIATHERRQIPVSNDVFIHLYDEVAELKNTVLKTFTSKDGEPLSPVKGVNEVDAIHSLNAAFFVQGLMSLLKSGDGADGLPSDVAVAVRIEFWTGITQTVLSVAVDDTVAVVNVIKQALANGVEVTSSMLNVFKSVSGGIGIIANAVTLGAQIYELVNLDNPYAKAGVATNIGFSAASLALSAVAMIGSATVSAVAGGAGVIIAGLGIGFSALVNAYAAVAAQFDHINDLFNDMYDAVTGGSAYTLITDQNGAKFLAASGYAVITKIDFSNNTYEYGSVQVNGVKGGAGHTRVGGWDSYFSGPQLDPNQSHDVYNAFGVTGRHCFVAPSGIPVVLPCAPNHKITFTGMNQVPGVRWKNTRGLDAIRNSVGTDFAWGFWAWADRAVTDMKIDYRYTTIDVTLSSEQTNLIIPQAPDLYAQKIHYLLRSVRDEGLVRVMLPETQADVYLYNNHPQSRWLFDITASYKEKAPWLSTISSAPVKKRRMAR